MNMNYAGICGLSLCVLLICTAGCGPQHHDFPGITDKNATVIEFDETGKILDFIYIRPDSDIDRIEFHAPKNGSSISVTTIGPNATNIPQNMTIGTKDCEAYLGKVTVGVAKGFVTSIQGNTLSFRSPINDAVLRLVSENMARGIHTNLASTVIIKQDRFKQELVEDEAGNFLPPHLSDNEQEFLKTVIPAIQRKDLATLYSLIHKRNDDQFDCVKNFLKVILAKGMNRYQFVRIDKTHPDNQKKIADEYSLPAEWVLTVYASEKGASVTCRSELVIGSKDGRLMFLSKYDH